MASLLEDLLDITRICRGNLTLRKVRVPVASIARSAIESVRPMIDEKHHRLLVSLPPEPLTVYADAHRLSQVLSNILTNAARYTDPGGEIELGIADEEGERVIRVKDNGIGMSPQAIEKIVTMFWQADSRSAHAQGGLGIGLSFVESIVHRHGGTTEPRSDGPGRGSEIIVRLPVIERCAHAVAAASTAQPAGATPAHRRILVAEADRDTADTLQMLLRLSRHEVRVAHSGQDGSAPRDRCRLR